MASKGAKDGERVEYHVDDCEYSMETRLQPCQADPYSQSRTRRAVTKAGYITSASRYNQSGSFLITVCIGLTISLQGESRAPKRAETDGGTVPAANAADAPVPKIAEKQGASHSVVR